MQRFTKVIVAFEPGRGRTARHILTLKEAAGYLRVHYSTLRRLIIAGRVPAFRLGHTGEWRLNVEVLDHWREKQEHGGSR